MNEEKFVKQYDYKANSNLVLPTNTGLIDRRPNNEATGEVQSLVGRISGKMGDKVGRTTNKQEDDDKSKIKKSRKKMKKEESSKLRLDIADIKNFSVADIEAEDLLYQPKSDITVAVYGLIIKFIRKQLGFQHNSIINGAADEVIGTMKNPNLDEETRRFEVDKLLSPESGINDDDYNELCNLCKKINDWDSNREAVEEEAGDVGVIVSDEDDADSDDYLSEVRDSGDEFNLEELFEKEKKDGDTLNLEELAKRQTAIIPKIDIGEPVRREGYHEYNIPYKRSVHRNDHLIKISDLPENQRMAFSKLQSLNLIQSRIYDRAMNCDQSLLICAPTGAGKTNIALLTMLREILKYPKRDGSGYEKDKFKIIYIAPIKALVQEIVQNFSDRLGRPPYNLKVDELTGDHQLDQRQISQSQIIICTPEKWDIVTRKSLDRLYTKLVRLVIFDEIHLLHNERGATLEALVARIKRHKSIEGEPIRIIGLSATLPNYKDVSRFIAPDDDIEKSTFYFDSSYRPIPLHQQYIAMTENKKAFRMINDIVYEKVVDRLAENSQILIFVHSRPDTTKTAEFIKCKALEQHKVALFLSSESSVEKINEYAKNVSPKLRELLQFGIGTHHAGMSKDERACVEDLFRGKFIKVLVSTATLAWGVNLPARTVIIKGTQVYRDGQWTDLDSLDVTQMLGRAGRPGYDKEGEGIVITQQSKVAFYISLMTEQLPVESKLIGRLPEFINAECVVGNIETIEGAVNWLSETYLSSRMASVLQQGQTQYMSMYGINYESRNNDPKLANHKHNLAYNAASLLDDRGLIVFDRVSGAISSTELGRIASNYNCSSRTMKTFYDSIKEDTSDTDLFRMFSLADEFKDIFERSGEKADLATLMNQVPFPIDDKRATAGANKVNVLLQVYIFRLNIEGSDLICDMHFIVDNAARLARAIHETVLLKGYANVAELSLDLCRKIDKRMTACHTPLRQFIDDLDPDIVNRLEKKNYHIDELKVLKSDKLAELLRCDRHQGEKIYRKLKYLPKLKVEVSIKPISKSSIKIDLNITPAFSWNETYHGFSERFCLLVEDVNQEVLLHHEMIFVRKNNPSGFIKASFFVPYLIPIHSFYYLKIYPDSWFGCDLQMPIYIEKLTLPDDTTIATQLLDLESQTIRSLENSFFEKYYESKFRGANFNQIQTQTFKYLYKTDEDLILLASAGSGKTTCAELAIIRTINLNGTKTKCGYIAANAQAAKLVYANWQKLFSHHNIYLLTGNYRLDSQKVDKADTNLVVGDPDTWHVLTLARKKYRKLMSKFHLFIIDDVHLLHNDNNSSLEWLCSKLRIVTKLNPENPSRIVVLGSPLACAESIKSWLAFEKGTKEPILLNYPPSIRPVKVELVIQKYHHYDYRMRLLTMQRPVYRLINHSSRGKPALVFVSDHHQAIDVSDMLIKYSVGEGKRFPSPRINYDHIKEPYLRECLSSGVGYLYRGMNQEDRDLVEDLFDSEKILVLVATVSMCWSIQCRSYLTILMDTQQHNGLEATNYPLTDIMQMIGLTGRPLADHECRCIIMCQYSKASYFDRFLREPLPVESELPANLISHVNYEIALGTISELNDIYKPYLAHTYFYKRISINPNYYGLMIPEDPEQKSRVFVNFFNNFVNKVALDLEKTEFISLEGSEENPTFSAGLVAKISLEYHISYETLSNYTKWLTTYSNNSIEVTYLELIELISTNTNEFNTIQVKHGELGALRSLQRKHVKHSGDQLHNLSFKIKLLILSQYTRDRDDLVGELIADRYFIIAMSHRLLNAIIDVAWLRDSFFLADTAIELNKKLNPFLDRSTKPNIEMDISISREDKLIKLDVSIKREDEPFSYDEFKRNYTMPSFMYRDENWSFLIRDKSKKFILFRRVKTPIKGLNEYKLEFEVSELDETYKLFFKSDFYRNKRSDNRSYDQQVEFDLQSLEEE